tara:strand:+ start:682 stop:921 length:240 start_codon:yes stop_codon:yes gene_type:complete
MDMIWVVPENRGQGAGLQLFNFWEHEMKKEKCFTLLTSSMSDEKEPQEFHKKNGFIECGSLTFGDVQKTPEIFFVKDLI